MSWVMSWVVWAQEPVDQSETAATIGWWHSWRTGDMTAVKVVVYWWSLPQLEVNMSTAWTLRLEFLWPFTPKALTEKPWAAKTLVKGSFMISMISLVWWVSWLVSCEFSARNRLRHRLRRRSIRQQSVSLLGQFFSSKQKDLFVLPESWCKMVII